MQGHVKSCHFPERIDVRRQYLLIIFLVKFLLFLQISRNNWQEMTGTALSDNDLDLLLPSKGSKIRLRLG